jgi:hypothetical protein
MFFRRKERSFILFFFSQAGNPGSVTMNRATRGCMVATIALCLVPNAHANIIDLSILERQLTPNETTNVFLPCGFATTYAR